jgi:hypothetical protein
MKTDKKKKKLITNPVYFSSDHTLDSWLGGKCERLSWELRLGKWRISIWKDLSNE